MRGGWLLSLFLLQTSFALGSGGQFSIQFKNHLAIATDLKLSGSYRSSSVSFTCESSWKPVAGSALHLVIEHSPELDSSRSFLSVTLNYGVLRSLRLDEHNESPTEITIPLPADMLRPDNELVFSVEQFPRGRASRDLWTSIKSSSFINIRYEDSNATLDVRQLPSPIIDVRSYRPQQLSVLLPQHASLKTVEATALLIANYSARLKDPLTIQPVRSLDAADGAILIVGTREEQHVPLPESQLPSGAQEGVIALVNRKKEQFSPALVVTANTPDGVSRAARKLIEGTFDGPSTFVRVSEDVHSPAVPGRTWKGFVPPRSHFTLTELGVQELKFGPQNGFRLSLPLSATPDALFLPYGHHMTLRFRWSPDSVYENGRLHVRLNGSPLGQFNAAEISSGSRASVQVKIPTRLLQSQNVLDFRWQGLDSATEADNSVWLLPSSEFDMPRDYESNLPDIALLQHGFFPFSIISDLSDTTILLPNDSGAETLAAVFELAAGLGRVVPSRRFNFSVKAPQDSRGALASSNVIALRIDALPKARPIGVVQESVSPWNADKYLLSITAASSAALRTAVKSLFSEATLTQLHGDTAYLYVDRLTSFRTRPAHVIREHSYLIHLQAWLRENWIALPAILTTVSCLLFVGLRLMLAQYKNRP
jgi:hypothetical protein